MTEMSGRRNLYSIGETSRDHAMLLRMYNTGGTRFRDYGVGCLSLRNAPLRVGLRKPTRARPRLACPIQYLT